MFISLSVLCFCENCIFALSQTHNFHEIVKGHSASLKLVDQGYHVTLLNIYAPSNSVACEGIFTHLANYLHTMAFHHCICNGDFNCTFEPNLDRNTPESHPESHKDETAFIILPTLFFIAWLT